MTRVLEVVLADDELVARKRLRRLLAALPVIISSPPGSWWAPTAQLESATIYVCIDMAAMPHEDLLPSLSEEPTRREQRSERCEEP